MKKKKGNIFLKILGGLFIVYVALFIANMSGYYESKIRDQVIVTEERIKQFEEKVQNGEEVDITSFLNNEREDYSSKMSLLGDNLTSSLENFVSGGMDIVGKVLKSLF
ncbi:MAG: hypothetical protein E7161_05080 [Firmicutes bacterium]|nr:hypothetical protein [Bacillota bacterium]